MLVMFVCVNVNYYLCTVRLVAPLYCVMYAVLCNTSVCYILSKSVVNGITTYQHTANKPVYLSLSLYGIYSIFYVQCCVRGKMHNSIHVL